MAKYVHLARHTESSRRGRKMACSETSQESKDPYRRQRTWCRCKASRQAAPAGGVVRARGSVITAEAVKASELTNRIATTGTSTTIRAESLRLWGTLRSRSSHLNKTSYRSFSWVLIKVRETSWKRLSGSSSSKIHESEIWYSKRWKACPKAAQRTKPNFSTHWNSSARIIHQSVDRLTPERKYLNIAKTNERIQIREVKTSCRIHSKRLMTRNISLRLLTRLRLMLTTATLRPSWTCQPSIVDDSETLRAPSALRVVCRQRATSRVDNLPSVQSKVCTLKTQCPS